MNFENLNGYGQDYEDDYDVIESDYNNDFDDLFEEDYDDDDVLDDYDEDYEDSDGGYEDSLSEDDDLDERRGRGRRRRAARRARRQARRSGARGRKFGKGPIRAFRGKGRVKTPAGVAAITLPRNLITRKYFAILEKKVLANNNAILKNGKAVDSLNKNQSVIEGRLAKQARLTHSINKKIENLQQAQMIGMLMPPTLKEVVVNKDSSNINITDANPRTETVKSSKFDNMSAMLPMMMSGGMGGGSSSNSMMLPMVMMMSQNNDSGDSDNGMMMAMMMMMMNTGK